MLELLNAKEITKLNVEYLKKQFNYIPKPQEINNLYKIIVRDRNWYMLNIEEWEIEREFNDIVLDNNEKGYFLLEYEFLFKSMTNFMELDEITYDKAIIKGFKEWQDSIKKE